MKAHIIAFLSLAPIITIAQQVDSSSNTHIISAQATNSTEVRNAHVRLRGQFGELYTGFRYDKVQLNSQTTVDPFQIHLCAQNLYYIRGRCLQINKNDIPVIKRVLDIGISRVCTCSEPFQMSRYFTNQTFDLYKVMADYPPSVHLFADSISVLTGMSAEEYYRNCREFELAYR